MAVRDRKLSTRQLLAQVPRALSLVWEADRTNALAQAALTVVQAALPAALAWVGKLIIDAVVEAARSPSDETRAVVMRLVSVELALAVVTLLVTRLSALSRELLRMRLGNLLNERLLEKSLTLELRHFEDSETYDVMQNARRESASRPLSLAMAVITIARHLLTLSTFAVLLWRISWWTTLVLLVAALPAFLAETKLSGEAFRLYSWRAPEGRRLNYLEWILTRDSTVKEVKLFGLGPLILGRYRALFSKFLAEDQRLAVKRLVFGTALGALSLGAFYVCYLVVAGRAASGQLSVGDLTLSLVVFRQGQGAFEAVLSGVAGMYEDALFLSNLDAFFQLPTTAERARVSPPKTLPPGPQRLELEHVSFRYPGKPGWALHDVTLTLEPGEKLALVGENGAGKSTLIKLLLRLYEPSEGVIRYGGVDLRDLDVADLRARVGAVFQDFVRYQFTAAENVGLGEPGSVEDRPAIEQAAEAGGAKADIEALPQRYDTTLGGWFEKGHELSGGQWQKLAVSRAFMRTSAEVLILDEPTAAIDAEAEVALFERFQRLSKERSAIIISHRFSTVRMADRIAVLEHGKLTELGTHEALVAQGGRYAHLFALQARGYR
ncbi:MAG: ABC transporter ATP-binding protein/permease [Myxococcaceae bacterium]|jgi:ABC-type multidrug transport system fused ATPase/permease subunit|nr:ABC transporter ATP-binding protein/permease [Myxococcaceae bacterium]